MQYDFTAGMEEDLDRIASGDEDRVDWLKEFYFGGGDQRGLRTVIDNLGEIDAGTSTRSSSRRGSRSASVGTAPTSRCRARTPRSLDA